MKFFKSSISTFLIVVILAFYGAEVSGQEKKPIDLKFGMFLKNISPDFKNSKFHAEFYWWTIFENDSTVTGHSNTDILNIEYVNGIAVSTGAFKGEIIDMKDLGNHKFYYTGFHQGDFYFSPDFKMYPFDKQRMDIVIENILLENKLLKIVPDSVSYIKSKQERKFWCLSNDILANNNQSSSHIYKTELVEGEGKYNSDFGYDQAPAEEIYGRSTLSVFIDRSLLPYISKFIIPLMIILLLVYFVFYLPAEKIDIAAALTVTSLLSAIAFQSSINNDLPEIGYIIYVSKIFYTCYFLIAISMALSLMTFYLYNTQDQQKLLLSKRIILWVRFIFPLVFIVASILFAL